MLGFGDPEPIAPAAVAPLAEPEPTPPAATEPLTEPALAAPVVVAPLVEPEPVLQPEPAALEPPPPEPPPVPVEATPTPLPVPEPAITAPEPAAVEPPPAPAPPPPKVEQEPAPPIVPEPEVATAVIPEPPAAIAPAVPEGASPPTAETPALAQRAPRPLGAPQSPPRPAPEAAAAIVPGVPGTDLAAPAADAPATPAIAEPDPIAGETLPGIPEAADDKALSRNRRLYRRVGLEAELDIDGVRAQLVDLSMDGFAGTAQWQYQSQAEVPVAIRMSVDGVHIGTEMRARIVYASELRTGGRFLDPTPSQTALLRYLVTWRGKPAGALGTANLLDAIAGLPERSPTAPPTPPVLELPGRSPPWWQRLFSRLLGRRRTEGV